MLVTGTMMEKHVGQHKTSAKVKQLQTIVILLFWAKPTKCTIPSLCTIPHSSTEFPPKNSNISWEGMCNNILQELIEGNCVCLNSRLIGRSIHSNDKHITSVHFETDS